jgi:hypothetical protein
VADGRQVLARKIAQLRELGGMVERAAPAVATVLEQELLAQVARQEGPDGTKWKPTEAGTPALQGTAKSLTVRAVGTVVVARLTGRHARHHLGAVRGKVKRPILPSGKIPAPATKAIERVVTAEFRRTMGGR